MKEFLFITIEFIPVEAVALGTMHESAFACRIGTPDVGELHAHPLGISERFLAFISTMKMEFVEQLAERDHIWM